MTIIWTLTISAACAQKWYNTWNQVRGHLAAVAPAALTLGDLGNFVTPDRQNPYSRELFGEYSTYSACINVNPHLLLIKVLPPPPSTR